MDTDDVPLAAWQGHVITESDVENSGWIGPVGAIFLGFMVGIPLAIAISLVLRLL